MFSSEEEKGSRAVTLDAVDLTEYYGVGGRNLARLCEACPRVKITARGNWLKAVGDEASLDDFQAKALALKAVVERRGSLSEQSLEQILQGGQAVDEHEQGTIVYTVEGRPIRPRGQGQERMLHAITENDLLFAVGPAGSGKTYMAIALAVEALKSKRVRRIILSRPAVEAGEKLGFLPGDMKEKVDPYLQPLYDALGDMIAQPKLRILLEEKTIEIAPLAFMRGRTLSGAFVILDEAQNTTLPQMKMFLTRLGSGSKMIVTGDPSQADLPAEAAGALMQTTQILSGVKGVAVIGFEKGDIVRHPLVGRIVEAFEKGG